MARLTSFLFASFFIFTAKAQTLENQNHAVNTVNRVNPSNDSLLQTQDSVKISFQFRGNCYAYSSENYARPSNGEAHSSNLALPTDKTFCPDSLYLFINTQELIGYSNGYLGCKLYLVNNTNQAVDFSAQDSRLNLVAEALDKTGTWRPISYLPSSWCGNSYHIVTLGSQEYWEFDTPIFTGEFKTKLRYRLISKKGTPDLISNAIDVFILYSQFDKEEKEGHKPTGIMDPYKD